MAGIMPFRLLYYWEIHAALRELGPYFAKVIRSACRFMHELTRMRLRGSSIMFVTNTSTLRRI